MGVLKRAGKWLAYSVFFIVALVFFVYMTLPLDRAQAYLVRKAADEHHLDLDITQISVVGLAGVKLEGVTITPQPTPEEMEAFAKARDARKAWREARKAPDAEGAEGAPAAEGKASVAKKESGAAAAGTKGKTAAKKKGDKGEPKAAKATNGKKGRVPKTAKTKAEAPPLPERPMPIYIERMVAKVSPMALMKGIFDGDLEMSLLGGTLSAEVHKDAAELKVTGRWEGLAIDKITALTKKLGLPVAGGIEGEIDIEVPLDAEASKPKFSKTTGHLDLKVVDGLIGPGQIASESMGMLDVPRVRMAQFGGRIAFASRKGKFENFAITGKDLEGDVQGYIQLADDLKRWGPRAHLQFKFSDAFLAKNKDVKTALTGFPNIRKATTREGQTGVQITGTFADLKPRLRKTSVYRRKAKARRGSAKKAKTTKGKARAKKSPRTPRANVRKGARRVAKTKANPIKAKPTTLAPARKVKPPVVADREEDEADDLEEEEDDVPEDEDEAKDDEAKDEDEAKDDEAKDDEAKDDEGSEEDEKKDDEGGE